MIERIIKTTLKEIEELKYICRVYIGEKELKTKITKRGFRYKLFDLILLLIYGILSRMTQGVEVEFYVEEHFEYLKKIIGLKSVPS